MKKIVKVLALFPEKLKNGIDFFHGFFYNVEKICILCILLREVGNGMRLRNQPLGNKHLIGARVEAARKAQGMKQKALLAQLQVRGCDITRSALAKIEVGQRHIYPDELKALKEIFGISYDELFV